MSQRFHSFRAPADFASQTSRRNSLPLPSVSSRKATTRFIRDVTFGIRSLSTVQRITVTAVFAVVVLLCCLSTYTGDRPDRRNLYPLRTTDCACPVPRTPEVFAEQILNPAGFVAKVRTATSSSGFLVFSILELYRGHSRAVQWPLLAHESLAVACYANRIHNDHTSPALEWLIVADGINAPPRAVSTALSSLPNFKNASILLPGNLKGPRCEILSSRAFGASGSQRGVIWMTPWNGLSRTVTDNILRDSGNEPLWWRTNDAVLEFKDSIRRAVVASDASSSTGATNHDTPKDASTVSKEWWVRVGVSVIAACKDRTKTLQQAILTWLSADGVNEVVVVDWSSTPPVLNSLSNEVLNDPRLVLVRVDGQSQWILSRAYNLAARSASFSKLLKVDCDTVLTADFFAAHELRRDRFYAGDWRQLESGATNALHTNGLLYIHRDDFLAVGGFDERITTYGWDDSDLAERLSKLRDPQAIAHDKVQHISHSASLRVANQPRNSLLPPSNPFAAAVEIQRNRLLLTKFNLPIWTARSSHMVWNVCPGDRRIAQHLQSGDDRQTSVVVISVEAANDVTTASALVSDVDAEEVAKRSIRLILRRLGLPMLPKTLTFDFYKTLIAKVANPDKYAEVVLSLQGGCVSKLLAHVLSKEATTPTSLTPPDSSIAELFVPPPYPYTGWRLEELWLSSDTDCSCTFSTIFDAMDEEVLDEWLDSRNPVHTKLSALAVESRLQNITDVLRSFSARSAVKNVSVDVAKWYQTYSSSKFLIAETYCSINPLRLSSVERKRIRRRLATLVPSKVILKGIRDSLAAGSLSVLDSPLLDIRKQSNLVSELRAGQIKESFASAESATMLSRWNSSLLAAEASLSQGLDQRARAVIMSIYLAEDGWDKSRLPTSDSEKLEQIVSEVTQVVGRLFEGCQASTSDYIDSYPELALIIAGFFSARMCL